MTITQSLANFPGKLQIWTHFWQKILPKKWKFWWNVKIQTLSERMLKIVCELLKKGGHWVASRKKRSQWIGEWVEKGGQCPGGYSTLSWVRMCGPKFRPPPYNKTREDANLLPILKPLVSWRVLFKTNQCFLQCKLGYISTFWQPIDKPKDKFIGNYAFCKNATYI